MKTCCQGRQVAEGLLSRYEKMAYDVAEKTAPGLWAKMTHPQRGVMLDIAYQTGDPGQFNKAWQAIANNDMQAFNESARFTTRTKPVRWWRTSDATACALRCCKAFRSGKPCWSGTVLCRGTL
jgi:hypothetical protein